MGLTSGPQPFSRCSFPLITIQRCTLERRLQYSGYCTNTMPPDYFFFFFFFLLRCARPVITKLAFNEGWRCCCCCCCCEGSSYTRQSGEKCRMYARRALSFSSWALAAFPRFSTRRGARFACHRRKPFSSGPWRATGNENTRGAHRLSFIFNARYILAGSL